MKSCLTIKCLNDISETSQINGLAHLQYCKFPGDIIEFDIALPSNVDKEAIQVTIPPLKYNKKMAFSYITDDSYNIYQYIFAGINKRFVPRYFGPEAGKNGYYYHYLMQGQAKYDQYVQDGFYPEHFLLVHTKSNCYVHHQKHSREYFQNNTNLESMTIQPC